MENGPLATGGEVRPAPATSLDAHIERLKRRCSREREARQHAEAILESKSLELYEANMALRRLNQELELRIDRRTEDLKNALQAARTANERYEHQALHDPLTGLPNRRFLRQRLDEMMVHVSGTQGAIAVLHVDLDRFKQINDTMGHAAGDFLLVHVAKVLRRITRDVAFVSRIGGDEFLVAATYGGSMAPIRFLAEAIVKQLCRPVTYESQKLRFGASVGVACQSASEVNPGQLVVNADIALYRAKNSGRGRVEYFTELLEKDVRARKQIADEILEAIEHGEFFPHYQPRFDAASRSIDCVEALVRWQHPERGVLGPGEFLEVAGDLNVISKIDDIVLAKAVCDFRRWRAAGLGIPKISVNVSHARLVDRDLIEKLEKLALEPSTVAFELLESIFLDDADNATISRIQAIKDLGIEIEIDDFGSGHASIVGVMRIQPTTIKIDRRIVSDILTTPSKRGLAKAIIDIGKKLNATIVAEGIETEAQAQVCTEIGCDSLQGFALARPMPCDELMAFVARTGL